MKINKNPELLSPAGTPEAFYAALNAGADAIYFGVSGFNARANARNFTLEEMQSCIRDAHLLGVKTYATLNTLLFDRELPTLLKTAEQILCSGIDAAIVADMGAACLLRKYLPQLPLHASTQCAVHNLEGALLLADAGFSRIVPARELSFENLKYFCKKSPLETEIFIHGSLCVSHSGQCLFSSMLGGRSGNRGECAQPCRMKYVLERLGDVPPDNKQPAAFDYKREDRVEDYPLSLRDLSLCHHIPQILECGVDSLKIEGRMKSPEYVGGVTKIFKRLLDQRRNATDAEEEELTALFSRGRFTDAYFISGTKSVSLTRVGDRMPGIRSDHTPGSNGSGLYQRGGIVPVSQQQAQRKTLENLTQAMDRRYPAREPILLEDRITRKRRISMNAVLLPGKPAALEVFPFDCPQLRVCVKGEICSEEHSVALDERRVKRSMQKLGSSVFYAEDEDIVISITEGAFLSVAALNELRRRATEELKYKILEDIDNRIWQGDNCALDRQLDELAELKSIKGIATLAQTAPPAKEANARIGVFAKAGQLTAAASEYFNYRFLSFMETAKIFYAARSEKGRAAVGAENGEASSSGEGFAALRGFNGIALPPVIMDSEKQAAEELLSFARNAGMKYALVANLGQLRTVRRMGFIPMGDLRLNICSPESLRFYANDNNYYNDDNYYYNDDKNNKNNKNNKNDKNEKNEKNDKATNSCEAGNAKFGLFVLSPELLIARVRDIAVQIAAEDAPGVAVTVYGRLPLMVTERCILRSGLFRKKLVMNGESILISPRSCGSVLCPYDNKEPMCLVDRLKKRFPVLREWQHRSAVYNSRLLWMADRQQQLDSYGVSNYHFIFTVETPNEVDSVIDAYKKELPPDDGAEIKRIR